MAGERGRTRTSPPSPPRAASAPPRAATPAPARPATAPTAASSPSAATAGGPQRTGRVRWLAPLAALVVVLASLGTVLVASLQDPATGSRADRAAASQARASLEQVLSYSYKTIDAQSARAQTLLTGSFKGEFASAMDTEVKPLAVKNQTVVQARVSDIGVMRSSPTSVTVLAFVNQARIGADQKEPVVDQNRVIATMTKVGDRWLVNRVDAF